jgi:hypothetical protein
MELNMANLIFLKETSTDTNASSLSVTDVFSSQYKLYKCIYTVDEVGTELATETRLLNSSGVVDSSNYDHASWSMATNGTGEFNGENADKWQYTMYNESIYGGFYVMYIYNPADTSSYTFSNWQTSTLYLASSTKTYIARKAVGVLKVAEAHTGIQVYAGSSNITKAKLTVYGVQ